MILRKDMASSYGDRSLYVSRRPSSGSSGSQRGGH